MPVAKKKSASTFAAYVAETMSPLGDVTTRPMFGGYNVAVSGITFGLIAYETLYLKVDDVTRPAFQKAGLRPFTYSKDGKSISMSYFEAPDCLDDWEALVPWVEGAIAAAKRVKKPASKVKRRV